MRSFEPKLFKAGLVAAIVTVVVPGQLMAAACNAYINGSTSGESEYILNQPIGINLEIGAGLVEDDDQIPGYLDVSKFEYQLDCEPGDTYPECTPAGNTVEFQADSVWTDCRDEDDEEIEFNTSVINDVVTFTPADPSVVIRNDSNTFCNVTFDVVVTALSDTNATKEVVELFGWANLQENVGVCDNGDVASAASSVAIPFTSSTLFVVTKDFLDDNPDPVDVHLRCTSGLPLEQSFTITESTHVTFTVQHFTPGELDCRVWEEPVPDGYTDSYSARVTASGVGFATAEADGCYFTDVVQGGFACEVTNADSPGIYTVNKEWILGDVPDDVAEMDFLAPVTIQCNGEILEDDAQDVNGVWFVNRVLEGIEDSVSVFVDVNQGLVQCQAFEAQMPSQIGVDNGCEILVTIETGEEESCLIRNSYFFEGIPTLGQYGKALLVLLMLGMGMVGIRRLI